MSLPLADRIAKHLTEEEHELEKVEQELENAVEHVRELMQAEKEFSNMLADNEQSTPPAQLLERFEGSMKETVQLVDSADQELRNLLEQLDADRDAMVNQ